MELTIKQTKALDYLEDNVTNEILMGGGAGGGKSLLGCYWVLKNCLKFPGTRYVIGRSTLKTLRETTLNTFYEVCEDQGIRADVHFNFNAQQNIIRFAGGSEILLRDLFQYPSDPNFDNLGSLEITGAFIDEVNQVTEKAWNILKSRIRFRLDENGLVPKILGTCNPSKGFLYAKFYKPYKEKCMPPGRVFIPSLLMDNPHISEHYRDNLLTMDPITKERLLFGNWEYDDDRSALINYGKILDLFTNTHVNGQGWFITADIARFGNDRTVIMVWKGLIVVEMREMLKEPLNKIADEIKRLKQEYAVGNSCIIVDEDGVGGGVVDILKCQGFINNSSPLQIDNQKQNFSNLKSQCYFKLAEMINAGKLYIKTENTEIINSIVQELEQVKQKDVDKDGKLAIIPKEKVKEIIGRSPDYSDTMMMRMYFELKPETKGVPLSQLASMFH